MKMIFTTLALVLSTQVLASAPANYYADGVVNGDLQDDSLRTSLRNTISDGHHALGYKNARKYLFGEIDLKTDENGDYYIEDVYCEQTFDEDDFASKNGLGRLQIPDSTVINCEHTWPQSKFIKGQSTNFQKSDLHHLFSTSSKANSTRGNFPFSEVDGGREPAPGCTASTSGNASKAPVNGNYSSHAFEPPAEHKGNVARAMFYFAVRYQGKIDQVQEYYLRQWHELDPVDEDEMARNDRIFELQGNRNPFIDHPELVDRISDF